MGGPGRGPKGPVGGGGLGLNCGRGCGGGSISSAAKPLGGAVGAGGMGLGRWNTCWLGWGYWLSQFSRMPAKRRTSALSLGFSVCSSNLLAPYLFSRRFRSSLVFRCKSCLLDKASAFACRFSSFSLSSSFFCFSKALSCEIAPASSLSIRSSCEAAASLFCSCCFLWISCTSLKLSSACLNPSSSCCCMAACSARFSTSWFSCKLSLWLFNFAHSCCWCIFFRAISASLASKSACQARSSGILERKGGGPWGGGGGGGGWAACQATGRATGCNSSGAKLRQWNLETWQSGIAEPYKSDDNRNDRSILWLPQQPCKSPGQCVPLEDDNSPVPRFSSQPQNAKTITRRVLLKRLTTHSLKFLGWRLF